MKNALIQLSKGVHKGPAADLIPVLFGERPPNFSKKDATFQPLNANLDHSQVCSFQYLKYSLQQLILLIYLIHFMIMM